MDPFTIGALITGGASLVGGYLTNQANARAVESQNNTNREIANNANAASLANQESANIFNMKEAQKNRDFQERMSNSAYARAMQDMRNAGLNPILAYTQGGAGTPAGATASAGPAQVHQYKAERPNFQDPISPAVASAMDAYSKTGTIKNAVEQLELNKAQNKADLLLKAAQVTATTQSAKNAALQGEVIAAQAKKAKLDGDWYGSETGKTLYYLNQINESAGGSIETLNNLKDLVLPRLPRGPKQLQKKLNKRTGEEELWLP